MGADKLNASKSLQTEERAREAKVSREIQALEEAVQGMHPKQVYTSIHAVMNKRHEQETKALVAQQALRKVEQIARAVDELDASLKENGVDLQSEDANTQRER